MIFETVRLIARRFELRDIQPFVAMRNDPDVARYQSWTTYSEDEARLYLQALAMCNPGEPGWFQFALEDKATGQFIGDCGLRVHESDHRLGQVGYTIARSVWGQGLATEAVIALTRYAFASFPLHRITASVDPRNATS